MSSSRHEHSLHVYLPTIIQTEMITISVKRGDRLKVVANAWHSMELESDREFLWSAAMGTLSHPIHTDYYEWEIKFAGGDVNMTDIHATLEPQGHLSINISRAHLPAGQ